MKIVFLNQDISGGGAEKVTSLVSACLLKRGYDVGLMTNTFKPFAYDFERGIQRHALFQNEKEWHSRFSFFYMVKNVRRMLKKETPDVIIGVMPYMILVAVVASVGLKTKVIASDHTTIDRPVNPHIRFIKSFVYRYADAVTLLTQTDYNILGNKLPQKVVIANPLAYPCIEKVENTRKKIILAIGRLDVWRIKGFDILIEAWSKIAYKYPDWTLELAGDGSDSNKQYLENLAVQYNVEKQLVFLGFIKNIDKVMRESSIFVLSSRIEGFGMVLVEAMSQGCACVGFNCGGRQREIITSEKEGLLINTFSSSLLADNIEKLIINDEMRLHIAENAVIRARAFNLDTITDRWESLLKYLESI